MIFEFRRFRFHFRSAGDLHFTPYMSGNMLRGAFGASLRKLFCAAGCLDPVTRLHTAGCVYARVFEPRSVGGGSPSGLLDWPRPFVFRTSHLDGRTVHEGDTFYLECNLFGPGETGFGVYFQTLAEMARAGFGPGRVRAELTHSDCLNLNGNPIWRVLAGESSESEALPAALRIDLTAAAESIGRVQVRFVTPTELKAENRVIERPEFPVLLGRLRDRISALRMLYGPGPLDIDFQAFGERAETVRLTRCELARVRVARRSSRTGQIHPLGGFIGEVEYSGELTEYLPFLKLGQYVGVGRHTVWGHGEIVCFAARSAQF